MKKFIYDEIVIAQKILDKLSREIHSDRRDSDGKIDERWPDEKHLSEDDNYDTEYVDHIDNLVKDNAYADMSLNFTYGFDSEIFHQANNAHEDKRKKRSLNAVVQPEEFKGTSEKILKDEEERFKIASQVKLSDYYQNYGELESFKYDKYEVHQNLTVSDVLTTNGWHINSDSVLFLSFRKKKLDIETKLKVQMGPYGNCFTFNHPYHQETAGSGNGLKIGLNIMQDYHTELLRQHILDQQLDITDIYTNTGVRVFVYDPKEHFPDMEKGVDIAPGVKASIS